MTEQIQPGRELSRLVAEVIGELRTSHPGFYWQEFATEDGDGGDGFSCPRCGKSVNDPGESTEGDCYKSYSTHIEDAMQAWVWLDENYPKAWKQVYASVYFLVLTNYDSEPCVMLIQDTDFSIPLYQDRKPEYPYNFYIPGKTYSHAISLAVIEAAKEVKGG